MGRSSLPFSVCKVWNLCILFRRQQKLCTVRMRGVSPEGSSELQSKIMTQYTNFFFALAKPRALNLGRRTLIFHSHGGSMSRAILWHRSWKSLVPDGIWDFLTHLGWRFSNALKTQFPLSIGSSLIQRQEKFPLLPWKRCQLSTIKGN